PLADFVLSRGRFQRGFAARVIVNACRPTAVAGERRKQDHTTTHQEIKWTAYRKPVIQSHRPQPPRTTPGSVARNQLTPPPTNRSCKANGRTEQRTTSGSSSRRCRLGNSRRRLRWYSRATSISMTFWLHSSHPGASSFWRIFWLHSRRQLPIKKTPR